MEAVVIFSRVVRAGLTGEVLGSQGCRRLGRELHGCIWGGFFRPRACQKHTGHMKRATRLGRVTDEVRGHWGHIS